MKIQMLVAGAFALIQSVVSGHEVPSFRGQVTKLQAESQVEVLADETEEEEQRRRRSGRSWRRRSGRSWRRRSGRGWRSRGWRSRGWRSRRWNRGGRRFRRRRGGRFARCMSNCGASRRRCLDRCNFTEEDILDLFEFTGGFSVMPDDEDFESYEYGAENIQDALDMVMESDDFAPDTIFASLMGAYEDDTCFDETAAIYQNEAFMASISAMDEMCPVSDETTEKDTTITIDYSGECGLGGVEAACAAASGKYVTYSITIKCKGKDHPEYTASVSTTSAPFCAGASCTEPTAEEQKEAQEFWTSELEAAMQDELTEAGIDAAEATAECTVSFL